jgi:hypothetical protein
MPTQNDWAKGPADYRNLLNPAFCGLVIHAAVRDYESMEVAGMPLPLSFLVLPLTTTSSIRVMLPTISTTSFAGWLHDNPSVRAGFARRTKALMGISRVGLLFFVGRGALAVTTGQRLTAVPYRVSATKAVEERSSTVAQVLEKARFVGRWFARSGDAATIYFLLGLRP